MYHVDVAIGPGSLILVEHGKIKYSCAVLAETRTSLSGIDQSPVNNLYSPPPPGQLNEDFEKTHVLKGKATGILFVHDVMCREDFMVIFLKSCVWSTKCYIPRMKG